MAALALPDDLARVVVDRTKGWPEARKRSLVAELRKEAERREWLARYPTPGALAEALNPKTVQTPALDLVDRELLGVAEGRTKRLMLFIAPQEGKSTRASHYGALWMLRRRPDWRIAIASYELTIARRWGQAIRDSIVTHGADAPAAGGVDVLGLRLKRDTKAKGEWQLDGHDGGVVCTGIGGPLTGRPVELLIIDDPVKGREQADSDTYRQAAWNWWTETADSRLQDWGRVVLIMTRWHEQDLAGMILAADEALPPAERQGRVLRIPAQADHDAGKGETDPLGRAPGEWLISARRDAEFPEGRTPEAWERKKRRTPARTWGSLYQGDPHPAEGGVWKWDWINAYRVPSGRVPDLHRVVVAVDTSAGGSDEAGIVAAGRALDGHTYVLDDLSGAATVGGWARLGWLAVLDYEADDLVYEANLVDPIMRKAIPGAWRRMRQQALALRAVGALRLCEDLSARLHKAAEALTKVVVEDADEDVEDLAPKDLAGMVAQLEELLPYAERVLHSPEHGPARVTGVHATRGKLTRAEPCAQAYEGGLVHHVGVWPTLESQMTRWQPGQDSPDRMDALVWAWQSLNTVLPGKARAATAGQVPTGAAAAVGQRTGGVPTGAGTAARR